MNYVKIVEDYLCELCDDVFNDGIVCDKVFNPEDAVNRSAAVIQQINTHTDQDGMRRYSAQILENRKARSECIRDMEIIDENFRKYGKKLDNGLVIHISIQYIMSPTKTVIGTQNAYNLSAMLNVSIN